MPPQGIDVPPDVWPKAILICQWCGCSPPNSWPQSLSPRRTWPTGSDGTRRFKRLLVQSFHSGRGSTDHLAEREDYHAQSHSKTVNVAKTVNLARAYVTHELCLFGLKCPFGNALFAAGSGSTWAIGAFNPDIGTKMRFLGT